MIQISTRKTGINKIINVPGDKSISHRAIMLGSISKGTTEIEGFLLGDDCLSTIDCFRQMGIDIEITDRKVIVHGKGLYGLKKPDNLLYTGNSGTTTRLLTGLLSGQNFSSEITGDSSIEKRPMKRVMTPIRQMGGNIEGNSDNYPPLKIKGSKLHGIEYSMPVASAQVKSAILLAGLYAKGETTIIEGYPSRDHTEIMLKYFGADIEKKMNTVILKETKELYAKPILVPSDISSAAYFIVAGLIVPGSHIIIPNVGVNVTRTGIITALRDMGGDIRVINRREANGEPIADIEVFSSELKGITIGGSIIPRMIDEIPVLAVAALFAEGETVIKDASELKVKESNRIKTMQEELSKLGANVTETDDGLIIVGKNKLHGAEINSHLDHRVAMSLYIAGLNIDGETVINDAECVNISFPNFYNII